MKPTVTAYLSDRLVVECDENYEHHLPDPIHRIDYQTGVVRLEFPIDDSSLVALRVSGVELKYIRS